jgi:hypothetical protein
LRTVPRRQFRSESFDGSEFGHASVWSVSGTYRPCSCSGRWNTQLTMRSERGSAGTMLQRKAGQSDAPTSHEFSFFCPAPCCPHVCPIGPPILLPDSSLGPRPCVFPNPRPWCFVAGEGGAHNAVTRLMHGALSQTCAVEVVRGHPSIGGTQLLYTLSLSLCCIP